MRLSSALDPVSMFDYNSRVAYTAPDINLDLVKNVTITYTNPSWENFVNTVKTCFPGTLMGLHSMQGT